MKGEGEGKERGERGWRESIDAEEKEKKKKRWEGRDSPIILFEHWCIGSQTVRT
jgi:hypothetical protein